MTHAQLQHRRAEVRNPGRIWSWPAFKISLDLSPAERRWIGLRAGLSGIDAEDHRLLSGAVKSLIAQEMAKSAALQKAKQQVNEVK